MLADSSETRDLLNRARDGDAAAVERLLELHREPLRRMIRMRLDPKLIKREDASDVVQTVLFEASRRLQDYLRDPVMPFPLWLRYIAGDHIKDAHRRHREAQRRSLDREQPLAPAGMTDQSSFDLAAQFFDHEPTPATAAVRNELQRRVDEAIAELPPDDREVILMRFVEQMSNQEVAADLGLSEAAASMRCLRALRRLKGLLAPEGGESGPA